MKKNKMIVFAGNVGAGKSTFTNIISNKIEFKPYYESVVDNPFLEDFYYNQKRWSYHLQTYFLFHRFKSIKDIIDKEVNAVLDRSIYEDSEIFAKNLYMNNKMSKPEYDSYKQIFDTMLQYLKKPDLLIYIKTDVKTILKRINKRGRQMEIQTPIEYWEQLNDLYNNWINDYDQSPIYIVDGNEFDIIEKPKLVNDIVENIKTLI
ncbi:deoxynucleoside kinase [Oceanotoga sp. DSM 15011]|jgi:deoxyadenosine/deoxycytidine kinase|uniref:Deoxyadenosine/deoxycytidine kinase n=1 Tax=Oceanotoga teriensis TaxID=515440 RepID=A0AA45C7G2_9BACT|nr:MULTISPECIES: deoxynucleoside kinase [Oceanotoga]MDN5342144.1 deoxyadenosine/deoxycytidine kinase [Oceanotoga sp.]MDO7976228.1 deoxynucleoside kinase [Oceanotoga teriensis]PWJ95425.1 deoxyadenosine/deoxycytidine kinase [Oceanotoga teriensis]UYP01064.1 deoxynucleoside kinase [Oceanotoga sp. DSM 15011]